MVARGHRPLLALLLLSTHRPVVAQGKHSLASPAFDCAMREQLLYARALELLPPSRSDERRAVFDALQLAACNATRPTVGGRRAGSAYALGKPPAVSAPQPAAVVHVATTGSDSSGDGSEQKPFATPARAQVAARAVRRDEHARVEVRLAAGQYFLETTLVLGPQDSGTTWSPEPGAAGEVVLSGGRQLKGLQWQRAGSGSDRTMQATLPRLDPHGVFSSLFVEGERAVRARMPNGHMERSLCLNPQFMSR